MSKLYKKMDKDKLTGGIITVSLLGFFGSVMFGGAFLPKEPQELRKLEEARRVYKLAC